MEDCKEEWSYENELKGMFYSPCWQQFFPHFIERESINKILANKDLSKELKFEMVLNRMTNENGHPIDRVRLIKMLCAHYFNPMNHKWCADLEKISKGYYTSNIT